jgi:hypothetical protein
MLNEFVEKILVHAPVRGDRERTQEVEIYLNFIGNVDIPTPEPTPEELEQMKIDQYWKDRYWKNKDRELARRKKVSEERKVREAEELARRQAEKVAALTAELKENPPEMPFEVQQVPNT